jgi:antitoxin (DNA-binding transcriptional repressor) of toxin-antitoxin stability system
MTTVTLQEVARDPLALFARVEGGESILVTRNDQPVAELRPVPATPIGQRQFGSARGEFTVPDDFDDPLPEEILRDFEGR